MVSLLGKLVNVSVKVPEEIKKLMEKVGINWSEYLRDAIEARLRVELSRDALRKLDEVRSRGRRVSTEEIVRWIREWRERE